MKVLCYFCKKEIEISANDLVKTGRLQIINEIDKILEKLKNDK